MHALSIVALALGATAVSAQSCAPYCQFPASLDCSGIHLTKNELTAAAKNADRSGGPYDASASDVATAHCSDLSFHGIPLYTTELPKSAGTLYYALNSKGTYFFCSTLSGTSASGWPGTCTENN